MAMEWVPLRPPWVEHYWVIACCHYFMLKLAVKSVGLFSQRGSSCILVCCCEGVKLVKVLLRVCGQLWCYVILPTNYCHCLGNILEM